MSSFNLIHDSSNQVPPPIVSDSVSLNPSGFQVSHDAEEVTPSDIPSSEVTPSVTGILSHVSPVVSSSQFTDFNKKGDRDQFTDRICNRKEELTDNGLFNEDSFMKESLFLLNSFIDGKRKYNRGFGPFIREGIATTGKDPVSADVAAQIIERDLTKKQIAELISDGQVSKSATSQVTLWLHDMKVGSFVIMRHEYENCPFLPESLKDDNGRYIGKVYVIGVITRTIQPGSEDEKKIAEERISELFLSGWNTNNFCEVSWQRMGMKDCLLEGTKKYINVSCQRTLSQICGNGKKIYRNGVTADDIRKDLWKNANIPIQPEDFPEKFEHELGRFVGNSIIYN